MLGSGLLPACKRLQQSIEACQYRSVIAHMRSSQHDTACSIMPQPAMLALMRHTNL
jgi:hypothetical protein